MKIIKIDKTDYALGIIKTLSDSYRLFGAVKEKDFYTFKRLDKGQMPNLSFFNSHLSPKSIIFPHSQTMFCYTTDEKKEDCNLIKEVEKEYLPQLILGIRPCDAASFLLVKKNFDTTEYKDPFWIEAYNFTTFVGLACKKPHSTCFCTTAGSGPFDESGLDILLVDFDEYFLAKVITEKGEKLVQSGDWARGISEVPDSEVSKIEAERKKAEEKINSFISTEKIKNKTILELYEAPFWEEETFSCINCGTCTYACPTCWCFDIQDENNGCEGVRMRNWDSCMFPIFTLHGSGHNPRAEKYQRVRQRFMHKLKYYVDKYGDGIQCVGCGRCIRLCPVNIDIRRICKIMNSYEPAL